MAIEWNSCLLLQSCLFAFALSNHRARKEFGDAKGLKTTQFCSGFFSKLLKKIQLGRTIFSFNKTTENFRLTTHYYTVPK